MKKIPPTPLNPIKAILEFENLRKTHSEFIKFEKIFDIEVSESNPSKRYHINTTNQLFNAVRVKLRFNDKKILKIFSWYVRTNYIRVINPSKKITPFLRYKVEKDKIMHAKLKGDLFKSKPNVEQYALSPNEYKLYLSIAKNC